MVQPYQHAKIYLYSIILIAAVVTGGRVVTAQSPPLQIILHVEDGIQLYQLAPDGTTSLLYDLTDFALLRHGEAEWLIPALSSIAVSPQGDKIAFTAIRDYTDSALFWFDLHQPALQQTPLPGVGGLAWSPDGSAVLLFPQGIDIGVPIYLTDRYLYTFSSGTLSPLPDPEGNLLHPLWLDNQRILYLGMREDCDLPCVNAVNLFVLDLNTQAVTRLTDIGHQLSADISQDTIQFYLSCSPHQFQRLAAEERLYYVVTCVDTSSQSHAFIYSTDLSGSNRLEANFPGAYPENFYTVIRSTHIIDDRVFFTMETETRPHSEDALAIYQNWRVGVLSGAGEFEVISETRFDGSAASLLGTAKVSPDGSKLMLGGAEYYTSDDIGYYEVIALPSGQVLLQNRVRQTICTIYWLDETTVIFAEFSSTCDTYFLAPTTFNLLNVERAEQEEIWKEMSAAWIQEATVHRLFE